MATTGGHFLIPYRPWPISPRSSPRTSASSRPAASRPTSASSRWRSRSDHARGRILVESRHLHPGGFVHGGVWTALGDTVAAWATFRAIPPGWDFTTIELKLNVFGAGRLGDEIVAEAKPLHAGRSTAVIEVRIDRIRDGASKLCANLVVSQFVIPPGDPLAI